MSEAWDVVIIGAGPVGGLTGRELASRGLRVLMLEEHAEVGKPFQCAGLVTPPAMEAAGLQHTILSDVHGARIHSPAGQVVPVGRPGTIRTHVVCRKLFDQGCVDQALRAGATLWVDSRPVEATVDETGVRLRIEREGTAVDVRARLLIGCDGAHSWTRRHFRLGRPTELMVGAQIEVTGYRGEDGWLDMYTGHEVAPGLFAWVVPNGRTWRIGVWVRPADLDGRHAEDLLTALITHPRWADRFADIRETARFCGPIPAGMVRRPTAERVILLGDAAGMAKPTTGGGIGPGFRAVLDVADGVAAAVQRDRLSARQVAKAAKPLEALRKDLERGRVLRDLFVTDHDDEGLERVFEIFARDEVIQLINEEGDIEHPVRLGISLLRKVPQFRPIAAKAAWAVLTN